MYTRLQLQQYIAVIDDISSETIRQNRVVNVNLTPRTIRLCFVVVVVKPRCQFFSDLRIVAINLKKDDTSSGTILQSRGANLCV